MEKKKNGHIKKNAEKVKNIKNNSTEIKTIITLTISNRDNFISFHI